MNTSAAPLKQHCTELAARGHMQAQKGQRMRREHGGVLDGEKRSHEKAFDQLQLTLHEKELVRRRTVEVLQQAPERLNSTASRHVAQLVARRCIRITMG